MEERFDEEQAADRKLSELAEGGIGSSVVRSAQLDGEDDGEKEDADEEDADEEDADELDADEEVDDDEDDDEDDEDDDEEEEEDEEADDEKDADARAVGDAQSVTARRSASR